MNLARSALGLALVPAWIVAGGLLLAAVLPGLVFVTLATRPETP